MNRGDGLTLRQAALVAGICYLLLPVTIAEFYLNPKVIVPGHIEQTAQNIVAHGGYFVAAILCYFVTLILDIVIAWALYILLAPVNRAVSLLAAWFRVVYTAVALVALLNLTTAYRLMHTPDYAKLFGTSALHGQLLLLLNSYRYGWNVGLMVFALHLMLIGWLIFRSGYIPKILGVLLAVDGVIWLVNPLKPYLYPTANLGFTFLIAFSELFLPLWLVIRGWKLQERESVLPGSAESR